MRFLFADAAEQDNRRLNTTWLWIDRKNTHTLEAHSIAYRRNGSLCLSGFFTGASSKNTKREAARKMPTSGAKGGQHTKKFGAKGAIGNQLQP